MNKDVFNRLVQEYVEVEERYLKLRDFIARNTTYGTLSKTQKHLLNMQLDAMSTYVTVLKMRIENIEQDTDQSQ